MKLNRQGRDELRAKIVEQLQNVPNGQRVQIKNYWKNYCLKQLFITKKQEQQ